MSKNDLIYMFSYIYFKCYWSLLTVMLFLDQNNKRKVLALQSGLKSELTWALNTLTLLSLKEKDDMRRDANPSCKNTWIAGCSSPSSMCFCLSMPCLLYIVLMAQALITTFKFKMTQIDDWSLAWYSASNRTHKDAEGQKTRRKFRCNRSWGHWVQLAL